MIEAPALLVQSLTKKYRDDAPPAVRDLDFTMPRGATWGLLGGNGAGKTTTIAMLLGLLVPTSGRIVALGHDMAKDRFAALARMNFSSPYVALPHRLSVAENLRVYAHLYGVKHAGQRIAELGDQLQLAELLHRPAGELSAGQKTRVALAKALINRPELLLLDEPTASLDPDTGDWVRTWLERYRAETGCAILLASHNMAEVERPCDHVLMLKQGSVLFFAGLMMMGRAVALGVTALILRHGAGAEPLAWSVRFGLTPFAAVFYPVSVLPHWLQPVAYLIPAAHVFEGMRAALLEERIAWAHLAAAFALNAVWLAGMGWLFLRQFQSARVRGALLNIGERSHAAGVPSHDAGEGWGGGTTTSGQHRPVGNSIKPELQQVGISPASRRSPESPHASA